MPKLVWRVARKSFAVDKSCGVPARCGFIAYWRDAARALAALGTDLWKVTKVESILTNDNLQVQFFRTFPSQHTIFCTVAMLVDLNLTVTGEEMPRVGEQPKRQASNSKACSDSSDS